MGMLERGLGWLAWFNQTVLGAAKQASWVLVGVMTVVILLQVFFRYVLGGALVWTEEVARFMMVWMTFLVAPIAYRAGANVALDILVARLEGRVLELLKVAINLFVILFLVTFFYESFGLIERGLKMKASTIDVQMAYVYAILPVSFTAMFLVAIELIGRSVIALIDPARARAFQDARERVAVE